MDTYVLELTYLHQQVEMCPRIFTIRYKPAPFVAHLNNLRPRGIVALYIHTILVANDNSVNFNCPFSLVMLSVI